MKKYSSSTFKIVEKVLRWGGGHRLKLWYACLALPILLMISSDAPPVVVTVAPRQRESRPTAWSPRGLTPLNAGIISVTGIPLPH